MNDTTTLPGWLFHRPPAGPPIRVQNPRVSADDAVRVPIQVYPDMWLGKPCERVVRFVASCVIESCAQPLWAHDDGRDFQEVWAASQVIGPCDFSKAGPTIGICIRCASDNSRWSWAYNAGAKYWYTEYDTDDANIWIKADGEVVVDPERVEYEASIAIAFSRP